MKLVDSIIICFGLSLDIFAYALYKGAMVSELNKINIIKFCLLLTVWQGGAFLLGSLLTALPFVSVETEARDTWAAFSACIFLFIGCDMFYKSKRQEVVLERKENRFHYRQIILWACITSIDMFLAGVGFGFLDMKVPITLLIICIVTSMQVVAGIIAGYWLGCEVKNKAIALGGCFLLIGGIDVILKYVM